MNVAKNAPHQARAIASRPECGCSVWPCPTCGAVNMEDAGNKCRGEWVCAADDQRQIDYERAQSTPNAEAHGRRSRTVQPLVVCSDGVHCCDCPHLKPYGESNDLTAKCDLTGNDLLWHDYWIAECPTHNATLHVPDGSAKRGQEVT